jgi:transmembrane protein 17
MIFAFTIMVIFEIIRLYLAYIGNLRERVPELTAFWLLTLIIELPLCLFELISYWFLPSQSPMLFSLELIHFIFVSLQTIFGFRALRTLARYQISRFHYRQFDINKQEEVNKAFDWFIEDTDGYKNLDKMN